MMGGRKLRQSNNAVGPWQLSSDNCEMMCVCVLHRVLHHVMHHMHVGCVLLNPKGKQCSELQLRQPSKARTSGHTTQSLNRDKH